MKADVRQKNVCNREKNVCVCIVLARYGTFPQEINGKSVKLAVWAVSLIFLHDFTLFVVDIHQIRLISLFRHSPTTFTFTPFWNRNVSLIWDLVISNLFWTATPACVYNIRYWHTLQYLNSDPGSLLWHNFSILCKVLTTNINQHNGHFLIHTFFTWSEVLQPAQSLRFCDDEKFII